MRPSQNLRNSAETPPWFSAAHSIPLRPVDSQCFGSMANSCRHRKQQLMHCSWQQYRKIYSPSLCSDSFLMLIHIFVRNVWPIWAGGIPLARRFGFSRTSRLSARRRPVGSCPASCIGRSLADSWPPVDRV